MPFGNTPMPYFPGSARASRFGAGIALTLFLMFIVVIGTLGIIAMKLAIAHGGALSMTVSNLRNGGDAFLGVTLDHTTAAMLIAATLNSIFITVFNEIYRRVGVMLTDWENHRTESEYENSLILKNAIFQAVNCYISFFYIAFVRPFEVNLFGMTVQGPSGDPLPVRDVCNDGDCMRDLVVQMLVVVVCKQFARNLATAVLPILRNCYRSLCTRKGGRGPHDELSGVNKLEHESQLPAPRAMYWEYNEMAIQFGYVTMFAAAAPWAATLCLLNNVFERKADALRMLYGQQRPMYEGASNIGACASRIAHHPLETSVAAAQVWLH